MVGPDPRRSATVPVVSEEVYRPGLEGVVAVETEIAEPDRDGGSLRYRGVDIEELVGSHPYEQVWGLLVDGSFEPGMPAAEPYVLPGITGNAPSDLQRATAGLSADWKLRKLIDASDEEAHEDLARLSATMMSIVAQSARGPDAAPVPPATVAGGETAAERFLLQWRGEADPAHVKAIDTYWICTAEHGLTASTFTAGVVASPGADCAAALSAAVGALSGPLHGGAPARVLPMLDGAAELGNADRYVRELLDRGERLMGFGHRVYRAEDPRARLLRETARELGSPRVEVAEEVERAALEELGRRHPERVLATNVEFWSAVVLDVAEIPADLTPAMFACARVAGWSAHILEQKRTGKLIRPSARYVGPAARPAAAVA
jgi:citrate synthase